MTTHLAAAAGSLAPTRSRAGTVGQILPGAAGLLYAGIQLDGGIIAAAYRGASTVPEDRLSFPFSGSLATTTSLTWGLAQALFVLTLLAFVRSGAVGTSRVGRIGAMLALLGGILFVAAHALSLIFRDARVDDPAGLAVIALFSVGTLSSAGGFIVAGLAVARAGRWTSWRRYSVLPVGIWMLCMLPLQFTSLLPLTVAIYAATITTFAVALLAQPESQEQ